MCISEGMLLKRPSNCSYWLSIEDFLLGSSSEPSSPAFGLEGETQRESLFLKGEGAGHSCRPPVMGWDARCCVEGQLLRPFHLRLLGSHPPLQRARGTSCRVAAVGLRTLTSLCCQGCPEVIQSLPQQIIVFGAWLRPKGPLARPRPSPY